MDIVAQKTKYNGFSGYLIKAMYTDDTTEVHALGTTFYLPVYDTGKKLMHVDEYGRAGELYAEEVVIDGQVYLKAYCDRYSIFYAEEDVSPVIDKGGNGINWWFIVGFAVGVVAVAAVAVYFIRKH